MSERIIVLGGSGLIGSRIAAALRASDWAEPVIASRRPQPSPGAIEQLRVDATDAAALRPVLQGAAGVINCVAGSPATIVANARALFEASSRCMPQPRVVYLSSMIVYGSATGIVEETAPLMSGYSPYGDAKIAAEQLASSYGGGAVILRPGIVYGPHSDWWSVQLARLLLARRVGDLGPDGDGICNLLYVEDMTSAALQALRLRGIEGRRFNLAMSAPPTWNRYFRLYAEALGALPLRQVSGLRLAVELRMLGPAIATLQRIARATRVPLELPPAIRPWLLRLTRHRIQLDVSAAEQMLEMRWTALQSALRATAESLATRHAR